MKALNVEAWSVYHPELYEEKGVLLKRDSILDKKELLKEFSIKSSFPKMKLRRFDDLTKQAFYTLEACLQNFTASLNPQRTALVIGTGLASLETSFSCLDSIYKNGDRYCSPMLFMNSVHNALGANLAQLFDIQGANLTFGSGDSSFETSMLNAGLLLENGSVDQVIVMSLEENSKIIDLAMEELDEKVMMNRCYGEAVRESVSAFILTQKNSVKKQKKVFLYPRDEKNKLDKIYTLSENKSIDSSLLNPSSGSILFSQALSDIRENKCYGIETSRQSKAKGFLKLNFE